jgi:hypothetical protein
MNLIEEMKEIGFSNIIKFTKDDKDFTLNVEKRSGYLFIQIISNVVIIKTKDFSPSMYEKELYKKKEIIHYINFLYNLCYKIDDIYQKICDRPMSPLYKNHFVSFNFKINNDKEIFDFIKFLCEKLNEYFLQFTEKWEIRNEYMEYRKNT